MPKYFEAFCKPSRRYFKGLLFLLIFILLFLTLGAGAFHNHCCDSGCHDDCPACTWLAKSLFVFPAIFIFLSRSLSLATFLCLYIPPTFMAKSYQPFRYLRSPPLST